MFSGILNWLFGVIGNFLLKTAVKFLEQKWPGLTPIIDQILKWLGQDVPPTTIASHMNKLKV